MGVLKNRIIELFNRLYSIFSGLFKKLNKNSKKTNKEERVLTEIDIYNNEVCKKALKTYFIGMIIMILVTTLVRNNFVALYIVTIIVGIFFARIMYRIKGNDEIIKNGRLVIYAGICNLTFCYAMILESIYATKDVTPLYALIPSLALNVIYFFITLREIRIFMSGAESEKVRKHIMIIFILGYLVSVISLNSFWLMLIIVPIMSAYSLYEDVKLIKISAIMTNATALIASLTQVQYYDTNEYASIFDIPKLMINLMSGVLSDRTLHMFWTYVIIMACFILYTLVMIRVTSSLKKFNNDKIKVIEDESNKISILIDKMLEIGMKIKTSAFFTQNIVNELDDTTAKSVEVISDVCVDNVINIKKIEEQTDMTTNIAELINKVVCEVKRAQDTTALIREELDKSKKSFDDMKEKSKIISASNAEIIEVINEFVEETRKVKTITDGIEYLLDETNLLSFNTFIKSAKDKEVGKGFAIIAKEIHGLADETFELTQNIDKLVLELELSAMITHNVINDIVEEINDETITIDNTIRDFDYVETELYNLGDNVNEMSASVDRVSESNMEIEKHVIQLKELSKEVSDATEDVGDLNEDNRKKIRMTNDIMNDLMHRAEKLEEYYYVHHMGQ